MAISCLTRNLHIAFRIWTLDWEAPLPPRGGLLSALAAQLCSASQLSGHMPSGFPSEGRLGVQTSVPIELAEVEPGGGTGWPCSI
jgi:hypothetical protein